MVMYLHSVPIIRTSFTQDVPNRPEVPKLPRFNSIDRFLVEDAIQNVINSKNLTKKECAESLLRISGRSSMPLNYMLVEVGNLFRILLFTVICR